MVSRGFLEHYPNLLADLGDPQNPNGRQKPPDKFNTATFCPPWAARRWNKQGLKGVEKNLELLMWRRCEHRRFLMARKLKKERKMMPKSMPRTKNTQQCTRVWERILIVFSKLWNRFWDQKYQQMLPRGGSPRQLGRVGDALGHGF